jgi:uncharacterized membrane protein
MKPMFVVKWKSKFFLLFVLFLQFTLDVTVLFDVPVARQVIGFLYLTFVPGFIIVKLLKLDELDGLEIVLFSAGFGVAFLMIAGLFINEFSFLFGVSQPLSLVPLMIVLNSLMLMGGVLVYLKSEELEIWKSEPIEKSPFALLLLCLPILSVVGAMYVNVYGNNLVLLFTIISISVLFTVCVLSNKLLPSKLYPFAVLMIAIAVLYHSSLISNYMVHFGSDIPVEYFLFKTTENNAHWCSTSPLSWGIGYSRINAMLSVTIFPTVYSTLLKIDPTWMFKLLFPLIFVFVPMGLYQIWQTYLCKKYALISTFLFMAQETFYTEMLGLNRQMIAELFFVLLLLVIVNKKMKPVNKMLCFMIFSFALVTSHYALAEIFLFFISFALISWIVLKRPSKKITISMVVFFFVVMFTWYIYTSGSVVFDSFLEFGDYVYRQLSDFFNPAARGQTVLRGLGLENPPTIWNAISRAFAYATQFLVVVGFVGLLTKRVKINVESEYFTFSFIAMAFLAALILVPGLANTLNMTRFYHILLFFLAPLCIIGAETLVKLLSKRKEELLASILSLIVLVPFFLFQTSFVYEVTGSESWSVSLSGFRMGPKLYAHYGVVTEQEVLGARWLSQYTSTNAERLRIHGVHSALIIYGIIPQSSMNPLSNVTVVEAGDIVYLGKVNTFYGIVIGMNIWNITSINDSILSDIGIIYSNGDCIIYKDTNKLD